MNGMRRIPLLLSLPLAFMAHEARAYCVHNDLRDRSISVIQEEHPERSREERKLNLTLAPGKSHCCKFYNLDCNPAGREDGVVGLRISIEGDPTAMCGLPGGRYKEHQVTVTGIGTLRVQANPRKSERIPYVIRVYARDGKDLTGPAGLACLKPAKE
jgi:hypothetical protein